MLKNGLVQIKDDKHNSKAKCVYLTSKGIELQKIACKNLCELKEKQYAGFSAEEREQFKKFMKRINENSVQILKEEEN